MNSRCDRKISIKTRSASLATKLLAYLLALLVLSASGAWAKPTTADQARRMVLNWRGLEAQPLGTPLGQQVKEVQTFKDGAGTLVYHVVYLNPAGVVLVPADDLVEPVIGFLSGGRFDPSPDNPLGALASYDLAGRVLQAREIESRALETGRPLAPSLPTPFIEAQRKWARLESPGAGQGDLESVLPSDPSDVRVVPFLQSKWDQSTVGGQACYNYYTPMSGAGSANNYACGCVATAMAQLMRYRQHPYIGVYPKSYAYSYWDGTQTLEATANLRGGNGGGERYNWAIMELDPVTNGVDSTQRRAIGALTYDAALSVNMDFNPAERGGSSADLCKASSAFVNTFYYSNAKNAYAENGSIPVANRNNMINPNLDTGLATLLGFRGSVGGHAVVCDGYGYNSSTLYHHLNMGWSGQDNAWYNLPTVDTSWATFDVQFKVVYNIYSVDSAEIVSGRVTTIHGAPIYGADVTLIGVIPNVNGSFEVWCPTNDKGIYAFRNIPSNATCTVTVAKEGYRFTPRSATTGLSVDYTTTTGNVWGVDFTGSAFSAQKSLPAIRSLLLD